MSIRLHRLVWRTVTMFVADAACQTVLLRPWPAASRHKQILPYIHPQTIPGCVCQAAVWSVSAPAVLGVHRYACAPAVQRNPKPLLALNQPSLGAQYMDRALRLL